MRRIASQLNKGSFASMYEWLRDPENKQRFEGDVMGVR